MHTAKASDNFLPPQERSRNWRSDTKKLRITKTLETAIEFFTASSPTGLLSIKPAGLMLYYTGAHTGGFATGHGRGSEGGGLQCLLRGALPATLAGFPGGGAVKTHAPGPRLSVLSLSLLAKKLGAERPGAVQGAPGWGAAQRTLDSEDRSATLAQEGKAPGGRRPGRLGWKRRPTPHRGVVRSSFLSHPGAKFFGRHARFRPPSQGVRKIGDFSWSQRHTRPADQTTSCSSGAVGRFWGDRLAVGRFCGRARGGCSNAGRTSSFPGVNR